jgi:GTP-binding protein
MDEEKESKHLLVDLHHDKQHFVLAKGGKGGKGNKQHQNMLIEERWGVEGEEKIVYFELKTLADIGLVGFPNIGKSTFLAAVSRALPKIANY